MTERTKGRLEVDHMDGVPDVMLLDGRNVGEVECGMGAHLAACWNAFEDAGVEPGKLEDLVLSMHANFDSLPPVVRTRFLDAVLDDE